MRCRTAGSAEARNKLPRGGEEKSENRETGSPCGRILRGMELDQDACYRAIVARDARFDGKIFGGVKTTGIYCRPICPARTPKRENIRFYRSAAEAEGAGFRPCLRCRPETAPDMGAWRGTSNTVSRGLALIEAGALDEGDVEALAGRLGVGERQLRRLFRQHLGAAPVSVAQTRRVLLAKQLIQETRMPMAEVAMAAGFGSVRRFNETFQRLYRRPPSALRRGTAPDAAPGEGVRLMLAYRPPYDWDGMIAALTARAEPLERVEDGRWMRQLEGGGAVTVAPASRRPAGGACVDPGHHGPARRAGAGAAGVRPDRRPGHDRRASVRRSGAGAAGAAAAGAAAGRRLASWRTRAP